MKNLCKFFTRADLPWVHLIRSNYYTNDRLPTERKVGSFWWRSMLKLLTKYKGLAQAHAGDGKTIQFQHDLWNGNVLKFEYPQLYSYTTKDSITLGKVLETEALHQLPLSEEAFQQFCDVDVMLQALQHMNNKDQWTYIWGNGNFSSAKAYNQLLCFPTVHPAFQWLWNSSCQLKHKVFFWLLLKDRLKTQGLLRRKNITRLYHCKLCILQKEESLQHLFKKCNFAVACWASIGITYPRTWEPLRVIKHIKRVLHRLFYMEIIILMCWSIWRQQNSWLFNNQDPFVAQCKAQYKEEFALVILQAKSKYLPDIQIWLESLS